MRRNKTGAMFLVTVLALAGVGITYAGFTDQISIYGTVKTATVDLEVTEWYSGTWVWKIWDIQEYEKPEFEYTILDIGNEILIYQGWSQNAPTTADVIIWAEANNGHAELVAESYAEDYTDGEGYDVNMVYDNIFPCIDFQADFIVHYAGSIPAKINLAEITTDNPLLEELWALHATEPDYGAWVEAYRCYGLDAAGAPTEKIEDIVSWRIAYDEPVDVGYQLHYCNYVYVRLVIHLPQDNYWQGISGNFKGVVGVIQWNDMCEIVI